MRLKEQLDVRSPWPAGFNPHAGEDIVAVELAGVAQIPDDVHAAISAGYDNCLSAELLALAEEAIWRQAVPEIQRRRAAAKRASRGGPGLGLVVRAVAGEAEEEE